MASERKHFLSKVIAGLLILFSISSVRAYESPLHYMWTYYLALHAGYSERQAYQIASAAFSIDWDESTGPLSFGATMPDGFYGAERARFFHPVINLLWRKMHNRYSGYSGTRSSNATGGITDLEALEKSPPDLLGEEWNDYFNEITSIAPAMRIWSRFHAFAPNSILDSDTINPLTGQPDYWRNFVDNYKQGSGKREASFKELDERILNTYNKQWWFCGINDFNQCLVEQCERFALDCGSNPGRQVQTMLKAMNLQIDDNGGRPQITVVETLETLGKIFDPNVGPSQLISEGLLQKRRIVIAEVLAQVLYIEQTLGLNWTEISRKFSQQWHRFDVEVDEGRRGVPLPPNGSNPHSLLVTATRAKFVQDLWYLALIEKNPGPILHYIQDLPAHGDFDTYHGHAMNPHRPDYIDNDINKARVASKDSITIMCKFRQAEKLDLPDYEISPLQPTVPVPGETAIQISYIWQPNDQDPLCADQVNTGTFINASRLSALHDDLDELAKANKKPSTRGLFKNAIAAVSGWNVFYDTELRTPNSSKAIDKTSRLLSTRVYDKKVNNIRDVRTLWPKLPRPLGDRGWFNEIFLNRTNVPERLIAFDFDACGQVVYQTPKLCEEHEAAEDCKNIVAAGYCQGNVDERNAEIEEKKKHNISNKTNETTIDLYGIERIKVKIGELNVRRTISNKQGYSTLAISLDYEVDGMLPGFDGKRHVRQFEVRKKGDVEGAKRAAVARLNSGEAFPNNPSFGHGAISALKPIVGGAPVESAFNKIPTLEHCYPLNTNIGIIPVRLSDIDQGEDVDRFGEALFEQLKKEVKASAFSRVITVSEDGKYTAKFTPNNIKTELLSNRSDPLTIACVLHLQGLRPIIMATQVGDLLNASFGTLRQGRLPKKSGGS